MVLISSDSEQWSTPTNIHGGVVTHNTAPFDYDDLIGHKTALDLATHTDIIDGAPVEFSFGFGLDKSPMYS
ncbi:hypothetical protein TNCV_4363101 [Trichonephila clavipes]|nr:hypothetical protein TNCV_4363101 [Trichonephila clavipes]